MEVVRENLCTWYTQIKRVDEENAKFKKIIRNLKNPVCLRTVGSRIRFEPSDNLSLFRSIIISTRWESWFRRNNHIKIWSNPFKTQYLDMDEDEKKELVKIAAEHGAVVNKSKPLDDQCEDARNAAFGKQRL